MSGCCCQSCHESEFLQRAAAANGNGEVFDVLGYPAVSFQVYGTIAGGTDVAFEFLSGISTWLPLPVANASDGVVTTTGIVVAAGTYIANTVGLQQVRARVLNYGGADSINVVATAVCEGTGTSVGGGSGGGGAASDVNVAEYGGVATTLGRKAAAASIPGVMSTEDKAVLDSIDVASIQSATTIGLVNDAALTSNGNGTLSAKLRGLVAILADVWSDARNQLSVGGAIADNGVGSLFPVEVGGKAVDAATYAPAYTAGDAAEFAVDKDTGALLVNPGLPSATLVATTAYAASLVVKNAAGTLISLDGYNSGIAQFIQVHNAAALPADTAVPIYTFAVPTVSNFSLSIPVSGAPFTVGIVVCNSSTGPTKTIGAANCWFTAVRI